MLEIRDYLLQYKRKIPNLLTLWGMILIFIITMILIINNTFKITNYLQIEGITKEDKLKLILPIDSVDYVVNNKYLYLDNKKYKYNIESIDTDIKNNNNILYQELILRINDKCFIDNNVIKVKFIIEKKTILEYIYDFFRG